MSLSNRVVAESATAGTEPVGKTDTLAAGKDRLTCQQRLAARGPTHETAGRTADSRESTDNGRTTEAPEVGNGHGSHTF